MPPAMAPVLLWFFVPELVVVSEPDATLALGDGDWPAAGADSEESPLDTREFGPLLVFDDGPV
jgi:hypothetical protein